MDDDKNYQNDDSYAEDDGIYSYPDEVQIAEAREAGNQALASLQVARESLTKASGWGMVDLFGGNIISGAMKYARINDAKKQIAQAKLDVQVLSERLGNLPGVDSIHLNVDGFLTFADFFLDGAVADILVQAKIERARGSVDTAIASIKDALNNLPA
ncbi:MAG: hypothetical protein ACFNZW_01665 [Coriobacteriaceae bacterium]